MGESLEIRVPDIGDFDEVEVVELLVAKGDVVEFDDPLVSVESDKATMEIPSSAAGVVLELRVSEGDRVSEGSVLVVLDVAEAVGTPLETVGTSTEAVGTSSEAVGTSAESEAESVVLVPEQETDPSALVAGASERSAQDSLSVESAPIASAPPAREISEAARHPVPDRMGLTHASPLARRYARELGVPIEAAEGSGAHGRVLIEDLNRTVRERFVGDAAGGTGTDVGGAIPPIPAIDHASFGPVHEQPLTRIQKLSGPALHRSWLNVPHVTQYDDADITELERFRRERRELASERGLKLSPLLFVMKAVALALGEFPDFRSSLAPDADHLIVKDYFHLGIAVDTDQGLVVPVIRDVDRKGIFELAAELDAVADRARARKLSPDDLKGACFTISSLGGIGGTAFSPIVNAPEVAILGLSKARVQPLWKGPSPVELMDDGGGGERAGAPVAGVETGRFEPRLVLPFSLSYDHRVIDGASAVRFTSRLSRILTDPLQLLL